jgi:hypothetical protein
MMWTYLGAIYVLLLVPSATSLVIRCLSFGQLRLRMEIWKLTDFHPAEGEGGAWLAHSSFGTRRRRTGMWSSSLKSKRLCVETDPRRTPRSFCLVRPCLHSQFIIQLMYLTLISVLTSLAYFEVWFRVNYYYRSNPQFPSILHYYCYTYIHT